MLTISDIRNAMTGSFLLARRDTSGLKFFDVGIEGFWRSFLVIVPIAPFYVLYSIQEIRIAQEIDPQGVFVVTNAGFIAAKIMLLVLDWLVFPIAMIFITRLLVLWPRYIPFIAVYNWSSLFVIAVLAPPALLYVMGIISAEMVTTFNLFATFFVLYYRWYVAKTILETAGLTAALIVAFDLILSLLVHGLFSRLTGY